MKKALLVIVMMATVCSIAEAQTPTAIGRNCTITWNANAEPDLAGYRVYGVQGGVTKTIDVLKPGVSTTCAALGTQLGGPLAVTVDAVDLVGNRSPQSVAVTVTQDIASPLQPSGLSVTPNP